MADPTRIEDLPIATAWNVQGDASHGRFADAVRHAFGIALPSRPNTTAHDHAMTAYWLGPRSWLLVAESRTPRLDGFTDKRDVLNAAGGALFDVSASRVALRVAGPRAAAVLNASCPLDLHPRVFGVGMCAQSVLGHVNALLHKRDDVPTFVVMVARSFARDVRDALLEVAARNERSA